MAVFAPSLEGIDGNNVSLLSALVKGTDEGKVVKVSANKTAALCTAEDNFCGVVRQIADGDKLATVQIKGMVTVTYTSTAPTVGTRARLVGDGSGVKLKNAAEALGDKYYDIYDVDATNTLVTFLLA
jgi:hypothetical protein